MPTTGWMQVSPTVSPPMAGPVGYLPRYFWGSSARHLEHVVEIDYPRVVKGSSTSRQGTPSLSSQPKQDRPTRERDRLDLPHQSYVQVPTYVRPKLGRSCFAHDVAPSCCAEWLNRLQFVHLQHNCHGHERGGGDIAQVGLIELHGNNQYHMVDVARLRHAAIVGQALPPSVPLQPWWVRQCARWGTAGLRRKCGPRFPSFSRCRV